jgi:hypothetical protein
MGGDLLCMWGLGECFKACALMLARPNRSNVWAALWLRGSRYLSHSCSATFRVWCGVRGYCALTLRMHACEYGVLDARAHLAHAQRSRACCRSGRSWPSRQGTAAPLCRCGRPLRATARPARPLRTWCGRCQGRYSSLALITWLAVLPQAAGHRYGSAALCRLERGLLSCKRTGCTVGSKLRAVHCSASICARTCPEAVHVCCVFYCPVRRSLSGPDRAAQVSQCLQHSAPPRLCLRHCIAIPERWGQVPRADVSAHLAQLAALYHRASPTLEAACATFAPLEGGDGAAAAQAGPGPACWEGPISGDPAAVRALARLHPARLLAADPDTGPGPWRQGAEPGAPRGALPLL